MELQPSEEQELGLIRHFSEVNAVCERITSVLFKRHLAPLRETIYGIAAEFDLVHDWPDRIRRQVSQKIASRMNINRTLLPHFDEHDALPIRLGQAELLSFRANGTITVLTARERIDDIPIVLLRWDHAQKGTRLRHNSGALVWYDDHFYLYLGGERPQGPSPPNLHSIARKLGYTTKTNFKGVSDAGINRAA